MSNISTQYRRVTSWVSFAIFIGNKGGERYGGKLDLFVGHLPEFRNGELLNVPEFLEIRVICRLIPLKKTSVVYEAFHQTIFAARCGGYSVLDSLQRGHRRTDDMQHDEGELPLLDRTEKLDVAQR